MSQTSFIRNVAIVEASSSTVASTLKVLADKTLDYSLETTAVFNTVVVHSQNNADYHVNILETFDEDTLKIIDGILVTLNSTREPHPSIMKELELVDKQLIDTILMLDNVDEILHYSASR